MSDDALLDRIRTARDNALAAEHEERDRIAGAGDNEELQRSASVRHATRQAVREALDDVLGETSEDDGGQR